VHSISHAPPFRLSERDEKHIPVPVLKSSWRKARLKQFASQIGTGDSSGEKRCTTRKSAVGFDKPHWEQALAP